ncbi:MAG: Hg(II)-responsive transcriptional regulator [Vicinamibacterales bacterium]|jgi:MerR family mercuric resistance operon transcriptional regulator
MSHQAFRGSIGALAEAAAVNVETIRFYQRKGLLAEPPRRRGEIRRYGPNDVARVTFIKAAQRLGFTLDEIEGLLQLDDGAHCDEARGMAEGKLNNVRAKLRSLRRIESALEALVADCCATRNTMTCPLIASLHAPE